MFASSRTALTIVVPRRMADLFRQILFVMSQGRGRSHMKILSVQQMMAQVTINKPIVYPMRWCLLAVVIRQMRQDMESIVAAVVRT